MYQFENNNDILKILSVNGNDKLIDISNSDKVQVMLSLKKYLLELRKTLNIDKNVKFGTEIEFEAADRKQIEDELLGVFSNKGWELHEDKSLFEGAEVVSPVLCDSEDTWKDLSTICGIVSSNAKIVRSASGHIHICMNILGNNPKYWRNFAKLWMVYENIIFRFLYGEYTSPRDQIEKYAKPISKHLIDDFHRIEDRAQMKNAIYMMKVLNAGDDRRRAINFRNASNTEPYKYNSEADKNTIECRVANGSFDPVIWQNNINLIVKLLEYAKSDNFNEEIIDRRLQEIVSKEIPSNLYKYSQMFTDQAFELADLIFNNNLDKIYFLRQYFKDITVGSKPLVKSKRFTI